MLSFESLSDFNERQSVRLSPAQLVSEHIINNVVLATLAAFTPKRTESQFRAGARASSKLVPALPQLRTGWFHTGQSQPWSRREQRHDVTANVSASELGQKHTADIFLYSGWK